MKAQVIYKAQSIKIGKIANEVDTYYIDIISKDGNQQTIATGSKHYVKSYINKIELQ